MVFLPLDISWHTIFWDLIVKPSKNWESTNAEWMQNVSAHSVEGDPQNWQSEQDHKNQLILWNWEASDSSINPFNMMKNSSACYGSLDGNNRCLGWRTTTDIMDDSTAIGTEFDVMRSIRTSPFFFLHIDVRKCHKSIRCFDRWRHAKICQKVSTIFNTSGWLLKQTSHSGLQRIYKSHSMVAVNPPSFPGPDDFLKNKGGVPGKMARYFWQPNSSTESGRNW